VLADARAVLAFTTHPRLLPCMVLAFASFGAVLGVRGLWGGPWLMEVKGLDRLAAGELLLWSAAALVAGPFIAGMVARGAGRLVPLVTAGHVLAAAAIIGLVAAADMPSRLLDGALLVAFGIVVSFQVMLFALVRSRVTPDVTGRALSAMNIFFFGGAAVLQAASGVAAAWGGIAAALLTFAAALLLCSAVFLWLEVSRSARSSRHPPQAPSR
jgi:predicted MFS family arabinose efflux permease